MQEHETFPGNVYAVTCAAGCTLTDDNGMNETVEAGKQFRFMAQTAKVYTSEPATVTRGNFKFAPAALLGLLGGGSTTTLPAGYIAAEFAEITTPFYNVPIFSVSPDTTSPELEAVVKLRPEYIAGGNFLTSDTKQFSIMLYIAWANSCRWNFGMNEAIRGLLTANKRHVVKKIGPYNYLDDVLVSTNLITAPTASQAVRLTASGGSKFILYKLRADNTAGEKREYIAAVDNEGKPCLYDTENKETFNIPCAVGFTLTQALHLRKLPSTGGTLTISLPEGYESDSSVAAALETARANGWTLTIQTYTPENATEGASTFALRRVWVRRTQVENGTYVSADGTRWMVDWCVDMLTPDGSTPDSHGYELFRSQEAAVAYWELSPYVDPEAEKMLQDELLTNSTTND